MNIEESIQQINELIEAWQLDEADLNQTDINAMQALLKENQELKDNWNKLKVYIKTEIPEDVFIETEWFVSILDKMQEIEESDSNE